MAVQLRPYQDDCLRRIKEEFAAGRAGTLAVLATGLGKTTIFGELAGGWPQGRVMIVAHREELVFQAANRIEEITGYRPSVEMADSRGDVAGLFEESKVVVASVQSLCRPNRLRKYDPSQFGILVVDEAHHCCPQNSTYRAIVEYFDGAKRLGVTATPDRADELAMGQYFDSVAMEYGIEDGANDGWLVPIEQRMVEVDGLDLSKVRTLAGDLNEGDLEKEMMDEDVLNRVAAPLADLAAGRRTLVFAVSVAHAEGLAAILNRHREGSAVCLHGGTPKEVRREQLKRFEAGEFQYLVGCALFLEGFDCPAIEVVAMARPTKSRSLYAQAVGRGTRTLPGVLVPPWGVAADRLAQISASSKPALLVLDFVGQAGRHKLITTADILGGRRPEPVRQLALDLIGKRNGGRMGDALNEAERMIREAERQRVEAERRKQEEERKRKESARRRKKAKESYRYFTREVDPYGYGDSAGFLRGGRRNGELGGGQPSDKQKAFLLKHGVSPKDMTADEAKRAADAIMRRFKLGLCSSKQAKVLCKYGESADCTKQKASLLFDVLKARGWKARGYPLTRDRLFLRKDAYGMVLAGVKDPQAGPVLLSKRFSSEQHARDFLAKCVEDAA